MLFSAVVACMSMWVKQLEIVSGRELGGREGGRGWGTSPVVVAKRGAKMDGAAHRAAQSQIRCRPGGERKKREQGSAGQGAT